jgi:hypothetical protein
MLTIRNSTLFKVTIFMFFIAIEFKVCKSVR